jgi:hypothetical protein
MVMLSRPMTCSAPTCQREVASIDRYEGDFIGLFDMGMYTDDCSPRACRDRDEFTICCSLFSCDALDKSAHQAHSQTYASNSRIGTLITQTPGPDAHLAIFVS